MCRMSWRQKEKVHGSSFDVICPVYSYRSVYIISAHGLKLLATIKMHKKLMNCTRWHPHATDESPSGSPCRKWLVSGGNDQVLHVVDLSKVLGEAPLYPLLMLWVLNDQMQTDSCSDNIVAQLYHRSHSFTQHASSARCMASLVSHILMMILIIMEICKALTPWLKVLNKHNTHNDDDDDNNHGNFDDDNNNGNL